MRKQIRPETGQVWKSIDFLTITDYIVIHLMRRLIPTAIILLACLTRLDAQTSTGSWYGRADVDMAGIHNNYLTELVIRQKGTKVEGIFGYYFKDKYVSFFVHGTYNPRTRQVTIMNIPLIYFNANSTVNSIECNTNFQGYLINSQLGSSLKGVFYRDEKYKYTCPDVRVSFGLDKEDQSHDSISRASMARVTGRIWKPQADDFIVDAGPLSSLAAGKEDIPAVASELPGETPSARVVLPAGATTSASGAPVPGNQTSTKTIPAPVSPPAGQPAQPAPGSMATVTPKPAVAAPATNTTPTPAIPAPVPPTANSIPSAPAPANSSTVNRAPAPAVTASTPPPTTTNTGNQSNKTIPASAAAAPQPASANSVASAGPVIPAAAPVITPGVLPPATNREDSKKISESFVRRKPVLNRVLDVESDSVRISFYDNGDIDGDSISVFINNHVVLTHQGLEAKAFNIYVKLDTTREYNEVSMFAENLGKYPPNTALMVLTDGKNRYEVFMSSSLTENATIKIHRRTHELIKTGPGRRLSFGSDNHQ